MTHTPRASAGESGNVLFYILLAVALLAALSFAVAQGGRTSMTSLSDDRQSLLASELIDYGNTLNNAAAQLRLRRVAVEDISFAHPDLPGAYGTYGTNPAVEIFNPEGGGAAYTPPIADLTNAASAYEFLGGNAVRNVGTNCATADCADLIAILPDVRKEICLKVNDALGIPNPGGDAPQVAESDLGTSRYAGSFSALFTITEPDDILGAKTTGCYFDVANAVYVFYQVLIPR